MPNSACVRAHFLHWIAFFTIGVNSSGKSSNNDTHQQPFIKEKSLNNVCIKIHARIFFSSEYEIKKCDLFQKLLRKNLEKCGRVSPPPLLNSINTFPIICIYKKFIR